MTQAPTMFYMRRIGFMALTGSILVSLAMLTGMFFVITAMAPITPA